MIVLLIFNRLSFISFLFTLILYQVSLQRYEFLTKLAGKDILRIFFISIGCIIADKMYF